MAFSVGSKLINSGEDRSLLLQGTGHIEDLHKPEHQCKNIKLAMVLQMQRRRKIWPVVEVLGCKN